MKAKFTMSDGNPILAVLIWVIIGIMGITTSSEAVEGYYKDLFMDGGVRLSGRKELPAAELLGLSMEYLATSDANIQEKVIIGNESDDNGGLLYPDGGPRFRCIQVNGGKATKHGASLGQEGRGRIRSFNRNGGSYTGTCAGAYICCRGIDGVPVKKEYFKIWPGLAYATRLGKAYTAHSVSRDSPLLKYYDFGNDFRIETVRHNGGCYFDDSNSTYWAPGTEVLARYALPVESNDTKYNEQMIGKVSCWAYKKDASAGRIAVTGSHPEAIKSGERRELLAALLKYALDGVGSPRVKAELENDVVRRMNDNSKSGHEKIGDKQYHHFTVEVPEGTEQLTISLRGDDDVNDLNLFLKKGGFAFKGEDGVVEATNSAKPRESITVDNPQAGMWYVGVKGVNTVEVTETDWGFEYTGNLAVLNGVSYSITPYIFPKGYKETVEGYYKDLFMDSGCRLTTYKHLPAATYLGLTMEYVALANKGFTEEDKAIQNKVIAGNEFDDNGVLLYPDGEPRFRFIYVNGGSATRHGKTLSEESRQRVRDFYNNGGSYTGSCAGAFISTEGTQKVKKKVYFKLWPGRAHTTGLQKTRTGHFIPKDSPLLKYYDYGGDLYVDDVYHNGGCFIDEANSLHWAEGTEILSRYDYEPKKMHKKVSTWALKKSDNTGRLVTIGSHPEGVTYGEQRDMMTAIFRYALGGIGKPNVKAALASGAARRMNDNKKCGYEKVGDKQYHHFTIDVPEGAKKLTIALDGDDAHNLDLFARRGDFAFKGKEGVITAENSSSADEKIAIDNPSAGLWYIAVKGVDTVETTKVSCGWQYCGSLEVLNGVDYTITAGW